MIACWRIQSLLSLLVLCGGCSGGFCFARPVGRARLQSPLGQAKRIAGRLFSLTVLLFICF